MLRTGSKQSAEQFVTMAGAVIAGLTSNSAFPAPTADLKAVQAATDDERDKSIDLSAFIRVIRVIRVPAVSQVPVYFPGQLRDYLSIRFSL